MTMTNSINHVSSPNHNLLTFFRNPSKIPSFLIDSNGDGTSVITKIRQEVLKEWHSHPKHFDILDRPRIENHDDTILRHFLDLCESEGSNMMEKDAIKKTVEAILSTLKWRKEVEINHINTHEIPKELYECATRPYIGADGRMYCVLKRRYLYITDKVFESFKVPLMALWEREYEKMVFSVPDGVVSLKPCLIIDVKGVTLGMENPMIAFRNRFLLNHFPSVCYEVILVGFSSWFVSIARMIVKILPKHLSDMVGFMTIEEMIETIGVENVPTSLGGKFKIPDLSIPEGLLTMQEFLKKKEISDKDIRGFSDHWKKIQEWEHANSQ